MQSSARVTLFPYTTLFRSLRLKFRAMDAGIAEDFRDFDLALAVGRLRRRECFVIDARARLAIEINHWRGDGQRWQQDQQEGEGATKHQGGSENLRQAVVES